MKQITLPRAAIAGVLALSALPASAHPLTNAVSVTFSAGFMHPFTGLDHLLAMLGVGMWSTQQGKSAALPLAFLVMMLVGAVTGVAGLTIPGLEMGIAASVALTGVVIALATRLPGWASMTMVCAFALLHGNAHGHELPHFQSAAGFMVASTLLLVSGRLIGLVTAERVVRAAGAAIAATGVVLMGLN
ncbi:HupE/UreJ family protein [Janthinobacterium agaricidamnosum]|uniref:HupE / UreJ family protein n=1 Tax=Janthinobacterium agaricidamnosum NBRC 102515 = DSM 9628 TaxID=1349767 RepID=W0V6K3_9BURK|nr:hupE / UreJ family protein [Janthinobacterium agaricidamnosum NBRC 102515 = DSM 9628]